MRIRIEITEVIEEVVDNTSYQKIADSGNKHGEGAIYGYVKDGTKIKRDTRTIYTQETKIESITPIIKAVLGETNALQLSK